MRLFFSAAFAAAVAAAGLHYLATGVQAHLSGATAAPIETQSCLGAAPRK